jgi:hypothetical protein
MDTGVQFLFIIESICPYEDVRCYGAGLNNSISAMSRIWRV